MAKDFFNQDLKLRDTVVVIGTDAELHLGTVTDVGRSDGAVEVLYGVPGGSRKELFDKREIVLKPSNSKYERVSVENDNEGNMYVIPRRERAEFLEDLVYADQNADYEVFETKYQQYRAEGLNSVKIYANFLGDLHEVD